MTENSTPTHEPDPATEDATNPQAESGADAEAAAPNANREAAKYRARLRETEAERDTLAQKVTALQRAHLENIAQKNHLISKPAALWAIGFDISETLDDDGNIDTEKAVKRIRQTTQEYGLQAPPRGLPGDFGGHVPYEGEKNWGSSFSI